MLNHGRSAQSAKIRAQAAAQIPTAYRVSRVQRLGWMASTRVTMVVMEQSQSGNTVGFQTCMAPLAICWA